MHAPVSGTFLTSVLMLSQHCMPNRQFHVGSCTRTIQRYSTEHWHFENILQRNMTRGNVNKGLNMITSSSNTGCPMDITSALQTSLQEAQKQGRLTCGVYQAASMLEKNPDDVMLCMLADDNFQDVALRIHFTLLEAFCWENDIRVIKIDASSKLAKLLADSKPLNDNDIAAGRSARQGDFSCVLIEYPKDDNSVADEEVLDFYKANEDVLPRPVITLPD